jgi:hypothetical protein
MDIKTKDTSIRLDEDVYAALEAQLAPGEKVIDLANQIIRAALRLAPDPPKSV